MPTRLATAWARPGIRRRVRIVAAESSRNPRPTYDPSSRDTGRRPQRPPVEDLARNRPLGTACAGNGTDRADVPQEHPRGVREAWELEAADDGPCRFTSPTISSRFWKNAKGAVRDACTMSNHPFGNIRAREFIAAHRACRPTPRHLERRGRRWSGVSGGSGRPLSAAPAARELAALGAQYRNRWRALYAGGADLGIRANPHAAPPISPKRSRRRFAQDRVHSSARIPLCISGLLGWAGWIRGYLAREAGRWPKDLGSWSATLRGTGRDEHPDVSRWSPAGDDCRRDAESWRHTARTSAILMIHDPRNIERPRRSGQSRNAGSRFLVHLVRG